jgi:hypothetical protein
VFFFSWLCYSIVIDETSFVFAFALVSVLMELCCEVEFVKRSIVSLCVCFYSEIAHFLLVVR